VERFPLIIHAGAAVLAATAARMIVGEPLLDEVFDHSALRWATYGAAVAGVLLAGWWAGHRGSAGPDGRRRAGHDGKPPRRTA
jgi:hypothetical protein